MATVTASDVHPAGASPTTSNRLNRLNLGSRLLHWFAIAVFLFLYLPIFILVIYSFNANKIVGVWTGFSLEWYRVLLHDAAIGSALRVSLWVATWSTLISTILGTLAALVLERYRFRGKLTFDAVLYLPIIIPDIVMALSTLLFFVILAIPLSRNTVLIAHVAFNISFVAVVVRARLADMDKRLEEAAADLGANEWDNLPAGHAPLAHAGHRGRRAARLHSLAGRLCHHLLRRRSRFHHPAGARLLDDQIWRNARSERHLYVDAGGVNAVGGDFAAAAAARSVGPRPLPAAF